MMTKKPSNGVRGFLLKLRFFSQRDENSYGCHKLGSSMDHLATNFPVSGSFFLPSLKSQNPNLKSPIPTSFPLRQSALRRCYIAEAIKGDVDFLLKGVGDQAVAKEVKQILEMARRASSKREVLHTDFLTPPIVKESVSVLENFADVKIVAQGGYPEAERCRILIGHPDVLTNDPDIVAALSITGNFGFQPCSHGDFLGAILGTGISREKLGDILIREEKGAQVLIVPELVDFVVSALDKVGNVGVTCTKIPLLALEYEPPRTNSFKTVEASLRIDAVASAGFKISRSKLVDLISNKDVRVNWATVTKNGTTVKTGDVVSVSGKGRLKIGEINETKKGKFAVEIIRYL
ncbi:RNA-binding S4 domain [Arabidopsis thaliana x Arabidopsis arenosa]|uniref:RNA-binding S4 domain n=1 Tax=Arabidopsis thaliana x Arabidopsis arenosa TaxID=1240361 RepID=A0A8T2CBD8_9BRAS|nr:RNA-binding S4 domain [Arabidopsis thaliana x Arabidopsis arenosa]